MARHNEDAPQFRVRLRSAGTTHVLAVVTDIKREVPSIKLFRDGIRACAELAHVVQFLVAHPPEVDEWGQFHSGFEDMVLTLAHIYGLEMSWMHARKLVNSILHAAGWVLVGELASPRKAMLPIAAAFGGMIVPALIYTAPNYATPAQSGFTPWNTPFFLLRTITRLVSGYVGSVKKT